MYTILVLLLFMGCKKTHVQPYIPSPQNTTEDSGYV